MTGRRVLRHRGFRDLWLGQAVSQFGDALYYMIFLFMVDKLTGNPAMVGFVGALQALPFLLLGPYAGVVADRVDRRKIMIFSDLASTALLLAFALLLWFDKTPPIWIVFMLACSLSVVNVFFAPAKGATIPRLVPAEELLEANALSAATQNLMPLLGMAFSGAVLGALYKLAPDYFFLVAVVCNGLTFLFSASYIARLPAVLPERDAQAHVGARGQFVEGLRYILGIPVLRVALLLSFFMNLFIAPFMVAYVTANREWFSGQYSTLAWIESAWMGGMLITSLFIGRLTIRRPGVAFAWGLGVTGFCVAFMVVWPTPIGFGLFNLIAGLAMPFAQIPFSTYIQHTVQDAFRGRVNAVLMMLGYGVMPIGMIAGGKLIEVVGLTGAFVVMGVGMGASAFAGLLSRPFRTAVMPG